MRGLACCGASPFSFSLLTAIDSVPLPWYPARNMGDESSAAEAPESATPGAAGETESAETTESTASGSTTTPTAESAPTLLVGGRKLAAGVEDYEAKARAALEAKPPAQQAEAAGEGEGAGAEGDDDAGGGDTSGGEAGEEGAGEDDDGAGAGAAGAGEGEAGDEPPSRIRIGKLPKNDRALAHAATILAANEGISLMEAMRRVSGEGASGGTAAATTTTAEGETTQTETTFRAISDIDAEIKAKKDEKRKAGKDLNTERLVELDEEIEALKEEKERTSQHEAQVAQTQALEHDQQVAASQKRATEVYPACRKADGTIDWESPLGKRAWDIAMQMEKDGNPLAFAGDGPFKIMQMAANELSIAPNAKPAAQKKPAITQQSSTSAAAKPAPVKQAAVVRPQQPAVAATASGAARTTQGGNSNGSGLGKAKTPEEYEAKLAAVAGVR